MRQSQFWPACCTVTCARALRHGNSRLGKNRTEHGEGVFVSRSLTRTTPRETDLRYDELASGATVWAYQGNPFGEQQPTSTAGYVLNLRYPGQYYDAETGTVYNGFRNYEPGIGRYLQSDPIGLNGGISTYAYVGNNPLDFIDPQGLMKLPANPNGLPSDWSPDPTHLDPNGSRFRDPSGNYLDFHKGRPGETGWKGEDHWHYDGCKKHLSPGDEVPDAVPAPEPTPDSENSPESNMTPAPSAATVGATAVGAVLLGALITVIYLED